MKIHLNDQQGHGFLYGIRPSYWNSRHQFICKMPGGGINI